MSDPTDMEDEEQTSSVWLSVVEHDHSQPEGYRPLLEDHIARVVIRAERTDAEGNPMPVVLVWLHTPDDRHAVMIGIDRVQALEMAERIRAAAEDLDDA
jgi:hypothetical protein